MARRVATVFGGSGFIGRHVVRRLAAAGYGVRAAVRDPVAAAFLKPMGDVEQVVPLAADITDENAVRAAVEGAELVVNLVGILYERGRNTFQAVHADGAGRLAAAAKAAGAGRFLQFSALGADKSSESAYARSKAAGEAAAASAFPGATILRPSVVFGPDDDFFNRFAKLARLSPVLPVFTADGFKLGTGGCACFGSGGPRFQPVYVGDVADAAFKVLTEPGHEGKIYELAGPSVYSMKQLMELVLTQIDRQRLLLPLPFWVASLKAAFLQYWPVPPLTPDQVKLLRAGSVATSGQPGLAELGLNPTSAEAILPSYLARYRPTKPMRRA